MVYTVDQIRDIVVPIAEKYALRSVSLFGSYARGTATEESDVDLLLDTEGTELKSLFSLGAVYCDLEDALQKKVDMVTMGAITQKPQLPSDAVFQSNVQRERVELYAAL